jgi:hypothetical protein
MPKSLKQKTQLIEGEAIPLKHLQEVLWRRGDLEFLLWEQQIIIWEAMNNIPPGVTEFVLLLARQFGKSTMGTLRALSRALKFRDCCILIMGPDTRQTKDIVGPKMRFLTKTAPPGLIKQMKSENRYHVYHDLNPKASDYTEIILGGMNENSTSQRGKTVQEIFIEEVVDVREDDFLESMRSDLGPALTHSKGGLITFLTTLPKVPDHPFIKETMPKAKRNNAFACYTIYDNKKLTKQQFDDCVDRAGGIESNDFKREYLCEVVRDTNVVVLPDWNEKLHTGDVSLPDYLHMHTTIDWGGVRDKTAAILHFYDFILDVDVFWDERIFPPHTPTNVIVEECKAMEANFLKIKESHSISSRFIDAPAQMVYVDLIQPPYEYFASIPNKPSFKASVNSLNSRFKQGRAVIISRCSFLIESARSGLFTKNKEDFERSESLGHCDGIAAMMYALRMRNTEDPYPAYLARPSNISLPNQFSAGMVLETSNAIVPKAFGKHRR